MPNTQNIPKNIQRWLANPKHPAIAPVEYAGKWVAWNKDHTRIVGHGDTMKEALVAARSAGHEQVALQRVPPVDEVLIGVL